MASLSSFQKSLEGSESVSVDANVLIYHLEDAVPYSALTDFLFSMIEEGRVGGHTSVLSLLEINVKSYQLNRADRAITHVALLKKLPNFFIHPVTIEIADRAAQLRAKYGLKTPDAIHVATALSSGSETLIGNDKDFRKVKEIRFIELDRYVA